MSLDPVILRALQAAGATTDMIIAAVEASVAADEERRERKRANNAERQRRWRERQVTSDNAGNALQGVTACDTPAPSSPPDPPNTPTPVNGNIPVRARKGRFPAPEGVSDEQWDAFCAQRKKALTPHAYSLICGKLSRFAEDGWPPGPVVDLAIERGWETVFEPKEAVNGHRKSNGGVAGHQPDPLAAYRAEVDADLAAEEGSGSHQGLAGGHGGSLSAH